MTIIVASADQARFHAALSVAAANAALARPTRLFLQGEAAALLGEGAAAAATARYQAAGLPSSSELLGEALALGVEMTVCQSGLALAGMRADELPEGIESGGLVQLLAEHADDRLLMA